MQNWGFRIISLLVFLVLARLLVPKAFGLVALGYVYLAFVQIFIDQGFSQALVQRAELEQEHLDTAFWISVFSGVLLTFAGIIAAGFTARLFHEPSLTPVLKWMSLNLFLISLSNMPQAILQRRMDFKSLAIRHVVAALAGGVVGIWMATAGYGVWSLVGQSLVQSLVGVFVLWHACKWRPGFNISVRHFRELFSFGINVAGAEILSFFNTRMDHLLIGYFLGPVPLGYYTVARRLLQTIIELLTRTIAQVALPTFSIMQKEPERLRRAFYTATQLSSLVAFPAFAGMAVLAPEIVRVVFGNQWLASIPVMQVLAFIGILQAIFYFNGAVLKALGKPSWLLGIATVNAVANVIGFSVAVRWGIVAVAAAFVIRGYLLSPIPVWVIRKIINIKIGAYLKQFFPSFVGSIVMVITLMTVKHFGGSSINLHVSLIIYVVIGAMVYVATIAIIAPQLSRRVFDLVRSVVPVRN